MKNSLVFLATVGALAISSSALANILSDGDFESFTTAGWTSATWGPAPGGASGPGYWTLGNGASALPGWTVGDTSIDVVNGSYSHWGNFGIDLAGSPGPGSISQMVATGAGSYEISFWACYTGDSINDILNVTFGGYSATTIVDGTFRQYTIDVTPGSGGSTLFEMATDPNNTTNGNLFIDNVRVDSTPEPFTMSLAGGAVLAGLAKLRRRKRQKNPRPQR